MTGTAAPATHRDETWVSPPGFATLRRDLAACRAIHVWRIALDDGTPPEEALERWLDAGERARARSYLAEPARATFVRTRAALRALLARYLERDAAVLRFEYGRHGKPSLTCPDGGRLRFNLAHSGACALVAVASGREVGVDVERERADVDHNALARSSFSTAERAALARLDDVERRRAFFRCWTRKEAYLKGTARGMATPLDTFTVTADSRLPPALVVVDASPGEPARWALHDLDAGPGYAAALAVERPAGPVRHFRWNAAAGMGGAAGAPPGP